MAVDRTLVLVKPDGVQRGLVGEILGRFERRGLHLVGCKLMWLSEELARQHYAEHRGKPFFDGLVAFITSSPVVAMAWEGPEAVATVRGMMGATDPARAASGTIRGDLAVEIGMNVVHGSDSEERGRQEIELFFTASELLSWNRALQPWLSE